MKLIEEQTKSFLDNKFDATTKRWSHVSLTGYLFDNNGLEVFDPQANTLSTPGLDFAYGMNQGASYSSCFTMDFTPSVTFEAGSQLTNIGLYAFSYAPALTSITIPASVTSIGANAFYGSGLTSIEIPVGMTSIGNDAFKKYYSIDCN